MKKYCIAVLFLLGSFPLLAGNEKPPLPQKLDATGFQDVLAKTGNVYIAGQPGIDGLKRMANDGVTTVISFRTPREMNDRSIVPFDESEQAAALGMKYINIPLGGGDHPYSPAALDAFAAAMDALEGKALIHCTVAWRASHMWSAYLAKYKGMDVNEAVAHGRAVNMGVPPVEALLGGNLTYNTGAK